MSGDVNEFLEHHGVKGQKWGIRRTDPSSSSSASVDVKDLTDEQIKSAINRMEMEQRYTNLISGKGNKPKGSSSAFIANIGKNFVQSALQTVGTHFINEALKKHKK